MFDTLLLRIYVFWLGLLLSWPAVSTEGDIFFKDKKYNASTYDSTNEIVGQDHYSKYGHSIYLTVDINIGSGNDDCNEPLYAPDNGYVSQIYDSTSQWGNAIAWTKGDETLFMAHLNDVIKTGLVSAGQQIATLGNTGFGTNTCHLHIESKTGQLELSGTNVIPVKNPPDNGREYTSRGFIEREVFCSENASCEVSCAKNQKGEYVGWFPDIPNCYEATQWFRLTSCDSQNVIASADISECPNACYP